VTKQLDGKVALVTGAARGQGRSHALRMAEEGAAIIAVDIAAHIDTVPYPMASEADLQETADLVEKAGGRVSAHVADVRSAEDMTRAVDDAVGILGPVDIVCANAGVISYGPAWELSPAGWRNVVDTNLTGAWFTISAALPSMMAAGRGGSIVVTSSFAGLRGPANALAYVAAKHGLVGLVRGLANELGPYRIRVNSIHPTTVNTTMGLNPSVYRLFRPDLDDPTEADCVGGLSSMQSLPTPYVETADITNAVLWLVSDEARYVTGVQLPVDGGAANK
jgi:SDR family mycofactocin-dependent oxidoreductase